MSAPGPLPGTAPDAPATDGGPEAATARRSWWRRNRWGVVALPFALVAALVGNASRVGTFFWDADLHDPVVAAQGVFADGTAVSTTAVGDRYERPVRVRLTGLRPATTWWGTDTPVSVPAGTQAVAVHLDVEAGQDADLTTCALEVVGADGTRYGYGSASTAVPQTSPCLLPDAPGFSTDPFGLGSQDTTPRPASWSTAPVVVLPAGVQVTEVRLSWAPPDYLALRVAR